MYTSAVMLSRAFEDLSARTLRIKRVKCEYADDISDNGVCMASAIERSSAVVEILREK